MEVTVLIIDDHPPIIEGYKSILSFNTDGYLVNTTEAHSCEAAYKIITTTKTKYDLVMVDYTMPAFPEQNLHCGKDLIPLIKTHLPEAKVMMLTSHSESLLLYDILKECHLDGILVKSDFNAKELLEAFHTVIQGEKYYTNTLINAAKEVEQKSRVLDGYNRQIIMFLSQGVQTKNLPYYLNLSKSAIDKRKVFIKEFFDIEKGTDEDILREARKQGLI